MAGAGYTDAIVTAWRAGSLTYVEAVRRLLDLGVSLDDAIKRLAADEPRTPARPAPPPECRTD